MGELWRHRRQGRPPACSPPAFQDSAWPQLQWTLGADSEPSPATPDIQPDHLLLAHLTAHVSDGIPLSFSPKVLASSTSAGIPCGRPAFHLGAPTEALVTSRSCEQGETRRGSGGSRTLSGPLGGPAGTSHSAHPWALSRQHIARTIATLPAPRESTVCF